LRVLDPDNSPGPDVEGVEIAEVRRRLDRHQSMIPKKRAPHLMRGRNRFPACAKPLVGFIVWLGASAGEGRSEKIMLQETIHQRE
jgi:hypothetical protein